MTIICALHQDGETWIGSDTLATAAGGTRAQGAVKKWIVKGSSALAVAGDLRALSVLQSIDLECGLLEVCASIKRLIVADGHTSDTESGAPAYGFSAILARPDGVWDIDCCCAPIEIEPGRLWARGSGMHLALGCDWALRIYGALGTAARVNHAVLAAIHYNTGCGGEPFIRRLVA